MTWKCIKCGIKSDEQHTNCSFCGAPKPVAGATREVKEQESNDNKLRRSIQRAVANMDYHRLMRLWRWMEDNIL